MTSRRMQATWARHPGRGGSAPPHFMHEARVRCPQPTRLLRTALILRAERVSFVAKVFFGTQRTKDSETVQEGYVLQFQGGDDASATNVDLPGRSAVPDRR